MIRQICGYLLFLVLAFSLCKDRARLLRNWRNVLFGLIFQIVIAIVIFNVPAVVGTMEYIANGIMKLRDATIEGTKFVFGYVGGGDLPFNTRDGSMAFILGFQALPTVILVSLLAAVLTYLKIIPLLANIIGAFFKWVFGIRKSLGMLSAAKVFLGQFESALLIKTRLESLSRSEMFIVISVTFATASASLMPIYATAISKICPEAMTHIIISSILGVISTLVVCSIMVPAEGDVDEEKGLLSEKAYPDMMTAITKGSSDGAFVWWAIVGSLIGMVALIALVNYVLATLPDISGAPITLQRILSFVMYPFAWLLGLDGTDASGVAQIMGTKFVLNETIAFFDMANINITKDGAIAAIYAITNFGNFACIGMTVGGFTAMCPARRDIARLGFRAFIAGTIATGISATLMSAIILH
jgi:CNT family concentrative nucleoside transporter